MPSWTIKQTNWETDQQPLRALRTTVFIEEQSVPAELEWDELDPSAWHLLALDEDEKPIGVARLIHTGQIGRMAVLPAYRRQEVGSALLTTAIALAKSQQLSPVFLHAQTAVEAFYRRHGFVTKGKAFMDAGIPHIEMQLTEVQP